MSYKCKYYCCFMRECKFSDLIVNIKQLDHKIHMNVYSLYIRSFY